MEATFTRAGPDDADLLLALMQEFYRVEHLAFDAAAARAALAQLLAHDRFGVAHLIRTDAPLRANDARQAVGYVVLTFGFSLEFHGRDAFLDELYVREPYRGRGLGRAALRLAEDVCRDEGIRALHLEVDHANDRARRLYRQAGYRDHDRYLLTKWLNDG